MADKLKRKRRIETGTGGASRLSDYRQLVTRGVIPPNVNAQHTARPPVDGLIWTQHARDRFAERIAPDLAPELLYDFLKGRVPLLLPYFVERKLETRHSRFSPYQLTVRDVCRVVLDWKPHNPDAPDADTRGVWLVITVLPYEKGDDY